eukprot:TRINITY_DN20624_c0_g2_i1.p1 TRINITY_DN20624_c0_g2~~TRINITY_DN20624_c0_g2_i1.p1  ORF type:complete len:208 (-),score=36.72 TRINITY_DN20624_c0_g2_i1:86-643(-)
MASESSQPAKRQRTATGEVAAAVRRGSRGLTVEGWKNVPGFEHMGLQVADKCGKKLPKTQSWCFVPLLFSSLGRVPEHLCREGASSEAQIELAQPVWERLFSHWSQWRSALRAACEAFGEERFVAEMLPKTCTAKSWTTSLVYGEPKEFGRLPHPQGRQQDRILAMLPNDVQNQIFASVVTLASG